MRKSLSLAVLAFSITIFGTEMLSSQQSAQRTPNRAGRSERPEMLAKTTSSSEVFLKLAGSAGQGVPAKRLADFARASDPKQDRRYWVIVDFSQPSTSRRFYLFDTRDNKVETFYVSHGRGSEGASDDGMVESFSNESGSFSSSLGIYQGLDEYTGVHGRSLRLKGLEPTNSNALDRAIVLHRADYVSDSFIKTTGRIGRSEGCFAVEQSVADALIDKLKNGAYIIAWKK